jgi:hypothetical protein
MEVAAFLLENASVAQRARTGILQQLDARTWELNLLDWKRL